VSRDPYQDDRGNKDRSITREGGGELRASPGTKEPVHTPRPS
jgi:branched-chain amino acid transport system ATP-binding protein